MTARAWHNRLWVLVAVVACVACQKPSTSGPQALPGELAAEEAHQRELVDREKIVKKQKKLLRRAEMQQRLAHVSLPIATSGAKLCAQLRRDGAPCVFDFKLEDDGKGENAVNAYADGERIVVTSAMMAFADTDEQLALVLSHELAHNVMGHVASKQLNAIGGMLAGLALDALATSQGIDTGGEFMRLGGGVGALTYSQAFESEADYVGLYIMAQSGYDPARAAAFWRRLSVNDPEGIYGGVTHPSNPERVIAMEKTLKEIEDKKRRGMVLVPDFKQEAATGR